MPRGGRRPGAGAPVGNMNALKTGTRSLRVRAILMALLRDGEARAVLLRLGARGRAKHAAVRELTIAMARLMHDEPIAAHARHLLDEAAGRTLAEHDSLDIRRNIARSEQASGFDAETGRPLDRPPLRTPEQLGEVPPARMSPAQRLCLQRLRDRMRAQIAVLSAARADDAAAKLEPRRGFVSAIDAYPVNPDDDLITPVT